MTARIATFLLTGVLLGTVQVLVDRPMLLPERFLPGAGWVAVAGLALYAAWVLGKLRDPRTQRRWRLRIWLLFSVIFFGQLVIGLAGIDRFLMTGRLHLPVPALVAAGPVFRGGGYFMLGLFASTLVLVGPAWCSHLCYLGAWSGMAASRARRPRALPAWASRARIALLAGVLLAAYLLRVLGVSTGVAAALALVFGLGGVLVMLLVDRRMGTMIHCTVYCPLGLLADLLGKVSPFRVRIGEGCDACGACGKVCRYDALRAEHIVQRRPGLTCSLCGDCLQVCPGQHMEYRFAWLRGERARTLFLVLAVSLHAAFLGLARI